MYTIIMIFFLYQSSRFKILSSQYPMYPIAEIVHTITNQIEYDI